MAKELSLLVRPRVCGGGALRGIDSLFITFQSPGRTIIIVTIELKSDTVDSISVFFA